MRRRRRLALIVLAPLAAACSALLGLQDHQPYPADAAPAVDAAPDAPSCGDTQSDPRNCGACGVSCGAEYTCERGVCGDRVVQLASGGGHACVLLRAGEVWCWGSNVFGQLGRGIGGLPACKGQCTPTPAPIAGLSGVVEIAAGAYSTCARMSDATVRCWGLDNVGQLGHASTQDLTCNGLPCAPTPSPVAGLPPIAQVTVGDSFACALAEDGSPWCWGDDTSGQLGAGAPGASRATPQRVAITSDVVGVAASLARPTACAAKRDGTVWCWGQNLRGVLGHVGGSDGTCAYGNEQLPCNATPSPVPDFTGFSRPRVSLVACADEDDAGYYCWGYNGLAQLGLGTADALNHPTPAPISVVATAAVATGATHTCALDPAGAVYCWGFNFWGEVGNGTLGGAACEGDAAYCVSAAGRVAGLTGVTALSAGGELTLALTADGAVWAWGANVDARLGHLPGATDAGAPDLACFADAGGGACNPVPTRVTGLP